MSKRKKQQKTEETYTQVIPIVSCFDEAQVSQVMSLCGTPRALTYNKLGSLQGWGLDWRKADSIIRTMQLDSLTGTLLGSRKGDRFIRFTGDVIQADQNAAMNILYRGCDSEITRWMKYAEIRRILILRTVRYLVSIGKSVIEAVNLGWLSSKFKTESLSLEAEYHRQG
jgi:hypothetical protein